MLKINFRDIKYCILFINLVLVSCNVSDSNNNTKSRLLQDTGIKYAKGFSIFKGKGYKLITVRNPWVKDKTLATYLLIEDSTKIKDKLPAADATIQVPVNNIVCMSTVYYSMLKQLGCEQMVSGITDGQYIYDTLVRWKLDHHQMKDLGSGYHPNVEEIINEHPDLIFKYLYVTKDRSDDVISYSGIPVIYIEEFTEQDPLARAEWIKCIGAFTGKEKVADSVFAGIEASYLKTKAMLKKIENKPLVLTGYNQKDGWATWGSGSYLARLIEDAGGKYYWQKDTTSNLTQVNFEIIYNDFNDADFWLSPGSCSFEELKLKDNRHLDFNVAKRKRVYSFCKRHNKNGGLDYYESGATRPDILIRDVASILHPELFRSYKRVYWEQLQ